MDKILHDPLPMETLGDIPSLLSSYISGELTPSKLIQAVHARIQNDPDHIWIYKLPLDALRDYALKLEARAGDMAALPLYGVPFAIKDNIDFADVPTTAACPAFSYTPSARRISINLLPGSTAHAPLTAHAAMLSILIIFPAVQARALRWRLQKVW